MQDRDIMENMLLLEKGACDLYMHGAIEASDERVFSSFSSALHQSLQLQNQIYTKMKEKGWYAPKQAETQQVNEVRQKFSAN
ncbi:MAG: spore coat protein [Eubacteriales bacterium]